MSDESASDYDMLQWMDADTKSAFFGAVRHRHVHAGQIIYLQGDDGAEMFRIERGAVRLFLTRADGRQLILLHLTAGDCFGDSSLVDEHPRPQTAQAVEDTELLVLDREVFQRLRLDHRSFDDGLMRLLARQMRAAAAQYANRNLDRLEARILFQLQAAIRGSGDQADFIRLSQAELAALVGASRQHVNRVVKTLVERGVIKVIYGGFVVTDRAWFARLNNEDGHQGDRPASSAGA